MMKWLRVGGYIFFRESCFHQSGDCKRKSNPTHYREPRFYTKVFSCLTSVHFAWFDCCFCISRINCVSSFVLHYSVFGSITDVDFYSCLTQMCLHMCKEQKWDQICMNIAQFSYWAHGWSQNIHPCLLSGQRTLYGVLSQNYSDVILTAWSFIVWAND